MSSLRTPYSETAPVHGRTEPTVPPNARAKAARGVNRIKSPSHVRYADGCTHRKCGWSSCSIGVVVSSMRLRTRNSRSAVRASARVQCRTSWILRTPSACRPCSVSTGPRFTSASQRNCSCSGDIGQVYNAPEYLLCADHFRAVATMMRDVSGNQTPQHFSPTQAVCCCSRLVALALDEEGFHVLVLQDLHGCALGSVSLRHREERLLRLRHHRAS